MIRQPFKNSLISTATIIFHRTAKEANERYLHSLLNFFSVFLMLKSPHPTFEKIVTKYARKWKKKGGAGPNIAKNYPLCFINNHENTFTHFTYRSVPYKRSSFEVYERNPMLAFLASFKYLDTYTVYRLGYQYRLGR